MLAIGLGVFGFAPLVFWSLTPKELDCALAGRFGVSGGVAALTTQDLTALMNQFPDVTESNDGEFLRSD